MKQIKSHKNSKIFSFTTSEIESFLFREKGRIVYLKKIEIKDVKVYFSVVYDDTSSKVIPYSFSQLEQKMKTEYGNITYNIRNITVENKSNLLIDTVKDTTSIWRSENSLMIRQLIDKINVIVNNRSNIETPRFILTRKLDSNEFLSYRYKLMLEKKKNEKKLGEKNLFDSQRAVLEKEAEELILLDQLNSLVKRSPNKKINDDAYYKLLKKASESGLFEKINQKLKENEK